MRVTGWSQTSGAPAAGRAAYTGDARRSGRAGRSRGARRPGGTRFARAAPGPASPGCACRSRRTGESRRSCRARRPGAARRPSAASCPGGARRPGGPRCSRGSRLPARSARGRCACRPSGSLADADVAQADEAGVARPVRVATLPHTTLAARASTTARSQQGKQESGPGFPAEATKRSVHHAMFAGDRPTLQVRRCAQTAARRRVATTSPRRARSAAPPGLRWSRASAPSPGLPAVESTPPALPGWRR